VPIFSAVHSERNSGIFIEFKKTHQHCYVTLSKEKISSAWVIFIRSIGAIETGSKKKSSLMMRG